MADRIPVWIDCDPGHDDAFALLIAATHPRLDLVGVSTVHGNASVEAVTQNARALLDLLGRHDVPLTSGAANASDGSRIGAQRFHGESGLAGVTLLPPPASSTPSGAATTAAAAMAAALLAQPSGSAWLVAIGSLTNVAQLVQAHPDAAARLAGVSIMGGAAGGNFAAGGSRWLGKVGDEAPGLRRVEFPSLWAEFNTWSDATAARQVYASEPLRGKITAAPLDLTYGVLATDEIFEKLFGKEDAERGLVRNVFRQVLLHSKHAYGGYFDHLPGPPLHDPLALAVVLEGTEGIEFDDGGCRWDVAVVTDGEQAGRTVLTEAQGRGTRWLKSVTRDAFWKLVQDALDRADSRS